MLLPRSGSLSSGSNDVTGQTVICCGAVVCTVQYLASLAPTYQMPGTSCNCDNLNYLPTLLTGSWGKKSLPLENHCPRSWKHRAALDGGLISSLITSFHFQYEVILCLVCSHRKMSKYCSAAITWILRRNSKLLLLYVINWDSMDLIY